MDEDQRQVNREVFNLSKKMDEVLHDFAERILDRARKGKIPTEEFDAMVDQCRSELVTPTAAYVRRASRKV